MIFCFYDEKFTLTRCYSLRVVHFIRAYRGQRILQIRAMLGCCKGEGNG
jgi:hypothetical protein